MVRWLCGDAVMWLCGDMVMWLDGYVVNAYNQVTL